MTTPPKMVKSLDFEKILAERKAKLLSLFDGEQQNSVAEILALESEPMVKLLQEASYRELHLHARINDAAVSNLILYATGTDLNEIARLFDLVRMHGESDNRFRYRLLNRIAALAGNGTREYYIYTAMGISTLVTDVDVVQPWPGSVSVVAWVTGDDQEILELIDAALQSDEKKMLGVEISTRQAKPKSIPVIATVYRTRSAPINLHQQLIDSWPQLLDEHAAMGKSISKSWIISVLHRPGVASIELQMDENTVALEHDEYPAPGVLQIQDGGVAW